MDGLRHGAALWTNLVPLILIGLVILRNSRPRTLRIERMWISPTIVLALTAWIFSNSPVPSRLGLLVDLLALCIGALLGWWRGRASRFTIDPETHVITSRVSPWGMMLILGIFAVRYLLRAALTGQASTLHVSAIEITDSFLLVAVGLVSAQRVEWLIRARRMLAEARAARS